MECWSIIGIYHNNTPRQSFTKQWMEHPPFTSIKPVVWRGDLGATSKPVKMPAGLELWIPEHGTFE